MKFLLSIFIITIILSPELAISSDKSSKYIDAAQDNLNKVQALIKEYESTKDQETLIEAAKNNKKAYENAKGYAEIAKLEYELLYLKVYGTSNSLRKSTAFANADSTRDILFVRICNYENKIAKAYLTDLDQTDKAQERYRNVIKKFKIDTDKEELKQCTKDAEFALDDLASMNNSHHTSDIEIKNIKKENELLKREIEILKKENEELKSKLLLNQSSK